MTPGWISRSWKNDRRTRVRLEGQLKGYDAVFWWPVFEVNVNEL